MLWDAHNVSVGIDSSLKELPDGRRLYDADVPDSCNKVTELVEGEIAGLR